VSESAVPTTKPHALRTGSGQAEVGLWRLPELMAGAAPIWPTAADAFPPDARALWSGTSFAAPQVAGAIAKIAMDDGVTPTEAKRRLLVGAKETAIRQASRDPAADLRT